MDSSIKDDIDQFKKRDNVTILAHYYNSEEIQSVADFVGDSLALAKVAVDSPADTVVVCGVRFMAETVKLLNPEKTVLLPCAAADCPMAHMVDADKVAMLRSRYGDDLAVACYVNSTLEAKALSDVCITSANALDVIGQMPQPIIHLIPDRNLGAHIAGAIPQKQFIFGDGCCAVHDDIDACTVMALKDAYPGAPVLVHPECSAAVRALADVVGSTSALVGEVERGRAGTYIMCTVEGVRHRVAEFVGPEKKVVFPAPTPRCVDMDKVTLEMLRDVLMHHLDGRQERGKGFCVEIDEELARRAARPVERMFSLSFAKRA